MDIFYICYDEPNKDINWADLLEKCSWAKKIEGVKGFDNAHKQCALNSETEFFITIDGDNRIKANLFDDPIEINPIKHQHTVFSFSAKNMVNGLIYGNGGVKIWGKKTVLNLKTHENAEYEHSKVDFCWDLNYKQYNNVYSETWTNASAKQAFRTGFREGVKMSLDRGIKVGSDNFEKKVFYQNYKRLLIWCSIGADIQNGIWSIYGARLGCYMTNLTNWDYTLIRDYDWFNEFWETQKDINIQKENINIGYKLKKELGLQIADFDAEQSLFYKKTYVNYLRAGVEGLMSEEECDSIIPEEYK